MDLVSDRLEAILARTDDLDAANVAHLAQSISEIRGKSHGLHGIHPGLLAKDATPPHSSHLHSPTQQGMPSLDCKINRRVCGFLSVDNLSNTKMQIIFRNKNDGDEGRSKWRERIQSPPISS